jgi:uncharacterized damage-inducible protein DinB
MTPRILTEADFWAGMALEDAMEIHHSDELVRYYAILRKRTQNVVGVIPREKIDWRYAEGKFSFADLLRHLASIERYMYAENARLQPSRYPGHGPDLADGFDAVLAYFNRCHDEAMQMFSSLSDEDLQQECVTPAGTKLRVWKWLRTLTEHEIHHRGQIYVYLGMLGLETPPLYGLTSEDVRERSR